MLLLHNIGHRQNSNYNSPEEIENTDEQLGFDGIYLNVWAHRHLLKKKRKGPTILFVMGNTIGGDNAFDSGMPRELYCDWNKIMDLVQNYGCELGWHTWSHPDLTALPAEKIKEEVTPPIPMKYFAYPYGNVNDRVEHIVREAGFEEAWSVTQGHGGPFQRNRNYLNW